MINVKKKKPFIVEAVSVDDKSPTTPPPSPLLADSGVGIYGGQNRVSAGVSTTPTTSTPPTMTYEQYYADESARLEKERQDALKQAEIYKERAAADAQASYMQNMSTYGVNAENMARMGLTGGGYSDYLNAQAYAQKRSDMQAADKNALNMEQQAESTYASGMAALNKEQMARNDALNKEQQAKDEYSNNAYTGLLADLQNPNVYGNYTEQGIRALGKQWGWDENKIQSAVNLWNGTKKENDILLGDNSGENKFLTIDQITKNISSGLFVKEDGVTPKTWEEIQEMMYVDRNNGANYTDEDFNKVKQAYDAWIAYKNGKVSQDVYYNANYGNEEAQNAINNAVNSETQQTAAREKAKELLAQQHAGTSQQFDHWMKNAKVVDTTTGVVDSYKKFNDDIGSNDDQEAYWKALKVDLGKVEVGQYIMPNYGAKGTSRKNEYFLCVAPGVFVGMPGDGAAVPSSDKIYVPNGYRINWNGNIKKE